jgi:hypothetical protein
MRSIILKFKYGSTNIVNLTEKLLVNIDLIEFLTRKSALSVRDFFSADFICLFPQISRISQIFFLKFFLRKSALSAGVYFSCRFHLFSPQISRIWQIFSLKSLLRKSALSTRDCFSADFIYLFPQISRISQIFFLKFFCVNQRYPREIFCYFSSEI